MWLWVTGFGATASAGSLSITIEVIDSEPVLVTLGAEAPERSQAAWVIGRSISAGGGD